MSNEKFTPGPWSIVSLDSTRHESLICNNDGVDILKFSEFLFIDKADAHLIAAAPEMYETLKLALGHINKISLGGTDSEIMMEIIEDTMQKARGEF